MTRLNDGYDVTAWPEVQALLTRLCIPNPELVPGFTISLLDPNSFVTVGIDNHPKPIVTQFAAFEVYAWDELKILCLKLGVEWSKLTRTLVLDIGEGRVVTATHCYICQVDDGAPLATLEIVQ